MLLSIGLIDCAFTATATVPVFNITELRSTLCLSLAPRYQLPHEHHDEMSYRFAVPHLFVCAGSDDTGEAVNCTCDSWQYMHADGEWRSEVTFPGDGVNSTPALSGSLFNSTKNGGITVSPIPASIAPAVSDSLYGRTIQLNLTCNQEAVVEKNESCVLFQVEFNNFRWNKDTALKWFVSVAPIDVSKLQVLIFLQSGA